MAGKCLVARRGSIKQDAAKYIYVHGRHARWQGGAAGFRPTFLTHNLASYARPFQCVRVCADTTILVYNPLAFKRIVVSLWNSKGNDKKIKAIKQNKYLFYK